MKLISTRIHSVLDYLVSLILIGLPWLFGFAKGGAETWVPVLLGTSSILYSLITHYELGLFKIISMRLHLILDFSSGAFLALSPWIFNFNEYVFAPHLFFGVVEILVTLFTSPLPDESRIGHNQRHTR